MKVVIALCIFMITTSAVHVHQQPADDCHQCYCSSELNALQAQIENIENQQAENGIQLAQIAVLNSEIQYLQGEVDQLKANQQAQQPSEGSVYGSYFSQFQPEWYTFNTWAPQAEMTDNGELYAPTSSWGQVLSFSQDINAESAGLLNCIFNGQVLTYGQGVFFTFFVDGQPIEQYGGYGSAKENDQTWETINMVQIYPISQGNHEVQLMTTADQSCNFGLSSAQVQCYVLNNNA